MIAALVCATALALPSAPGPDLERVVLQTSAGGIVVALYFNQAPKTVEHFKRLVRAGVYDGVRFARAQAGYLVQAADAVDRARDLTEEQAALLRPVQRELNGLLHLRGSLSMAHGANDPDGAISSFSILAGTAPHLDGEYTVFGRVEEGLDVLDELASVPTSQTHRPLIFMSIVRAEVVEGADKASAVRWHRQSLFSQVLAASDKGIRREVAFLIAAMLFCTGALAALGRAASARVRRAVQMTTILLCGFGLVLALLPLGQRVPAIASVLFLGLVGLLKWMNRFELPPTPSPAPPPQR